MCLIIHRPKDAPPITSGWLADFRRKNDNGFGAWWIDGPDIRIIKTLKAEEIEPLVRRVETTNVEAGFHWRQATHGIERTDNVHPFRVAIAKPHKLALAHNGILNDWAPKGGRAAELTDTQCFITECFEPLCQRLSIAAFFRDTSFETELLELVIGANRLLLTHSKYGFARVGSGWTQWRGLYLSNTYAWSHSQKDREDGPIAAQSYSYDYTSSSHYKYRQNAWRDATNPRPYEGADGWVYKDGVWKPPPDKPVMPKSAARAQTLSKRALKRLEKQAELKAKAATMEKGSDGLYRFPGDIRPPTQLALPSPARADNQHPGEAAPARRPSVPITVPATPRPPVVLDSLRDTADLLAGMSEKEIQVWCESEPYEAARLIQEISRQAGWQGI